MLIQHSAILLRCWADFKLRHPIRPSLHFEDVPLVPISNAGEKQVFTTSFGSETNVRWDAECIPGRGAGGY
eukprot:3663633-Prorocentrum_lima.AAC.1